MGNRGNKGNKGASPSLPSFTTLMSNYSVANPSMTVDTFCTSTGAMKYVYDDMNEIVYNIKSSLSLTY